MKRLLREILGWAWLLVFTALVLVLVGMAVAGVIGKEYNDSDCRVREEPLGRNHDERPAECREICKDGPAWFIWGHHDFCYWDDGEVPA
jgi:hypothetical protein